SPRTPPEGAALWTPAKGPRPLDPMTPSRGFQRPQAFGGGPGGSASWRVSGRSPEPSSPSSGASFNSALDAAAPAERPMPDEQTVIARCEGRVGRLVLNRPQ